MSIVKNNFSIVRNSALHKGYIVLECTLLLSLLILIAYVLSTVSPHNIFIYGEISRLQMVMATARHHALIKQTPQTIIFHDNTYRYDMKNYRLSPTVRFGYVEYVKGPPSRSTRRLHKASTFKGDKITFYPDGTSDAGSLYILDEMTQAFYAVTCGVSSLSTKRYYYQDRWIRN